MRLYAPATSCEQKTAAKSFSCSMFSQARMYSIGFI